MHYDASYTHYDLTKATPKEDNVPYWSTTASTINMTAGSTAPVQWQWNVVSPSIGPFPPVPAYNQYAVQENFESWVDLNPVKMEVRKEEPEWDE